jgi:hypothetical protein
MPVSSSARCLDSKPVVFVEFSSHLAGDLPLTQQITSKRTWLTAGRSRRRVASAL